MWSFNKVNNQFLWFLPNENFVNTFSKSLLITTLLLSHYPSSTSHNEQKWTVTLSLHTTAWFTIFYPISLLQKIVSYLKWSNLARVSKFLSISFPCPKYWLSIECNYLFIEPCFLKSFSILVYRWLFLLSLKIKSPQFF